MIVDSANTEDCKNDCPVKSLASYVKDNNAAAGINGTYFCPPDYLECAGKINSYDFTIYNTKLNKWMNKINIYWNDRAILYKTDKTVGFNKQSNKTWRSFRIGDWPAQVIFGHPDLPDHKIEAAIVNAPGLLENSTEISTNFPLTDKQKSRSTKMGIGINRNSNTVYLVAAYGITMSEFGYVFKAIGATDALNLDSGGSSALWFSGYKIGPGRLLPNAVLITKK